MNLNQITPGTDYAFLPSRGRGEEFRFCDRDNDKWYDGTYLDRYFVYRVKAVRTFSKREFGNKRDTGYVDVFWLTDDGEFRYDENGQEIIKTTRVRDVATVWDDYADELDYRTVQRDKLEAEREQRLKEQRERYEREEAERRERIRIENERIEREQREREEARRIEQERLEKERMIYLGKIEQHYGLPAGSLVKSAIDNGNVDLVLDKRMIDLDMQAVSGLMKWSK